MVTQHPAPRKERWCPLNSRLDGPQSWFGQLPVSGSNPVPPRSSSHYSDWAIAALWTAHNAQFVIQNWTSEQVSQFSHNNQPTIAPAPPVLMHSGRQVQARTRPHAAVDCLVWFSRHYKSSDHTECSQHDKCQFVLVLFPRSPSQFKKSHFARDVRAKLLDVFVVAPLASFTTSCSDDCSSAKSSDRPHIQTKHCRHQPCANLLSRRSRDRYPVRLAPYHMLVNLRSVGFCRVSVRKVRDAGSVKPQPIPSKCIAMHHPTIMMISALCCYIQCDSV